MLGFIDAAAMARGDYYDSAFGVVYSTYMERPLLSRTISRVVWGGDDKRYYESMSAIGAHLGSSLDALGD